MTTKHYVDLHVHTNCSDGAFSPREAVRYAHKVGLAAVSITDHDTAEGISEAVDEGKQLGIEVIPGVELSAELSLPEKSEMHILGYYINWANQQFQESLTFFRQVRQQRAQKILEKLAKLNVHLDKDRLFKRSGGGAIGRLHIAKSLIEEGYAYNINDAFQRLLGIGKPAYVPKVKLTPDEAIRMIIKVGGIAVLAHPYYGHYSNRNILKGLISSGLRGIEVWHSKHPPSSVDMFMKLADELHLLKTGGSDCHGIFDGEPAVMGTVKVPYQVVEELKKYKESVDSGAAGFFSDEKA